MADSGAEVSQGSRYFSRQSESRLPAEVRGKTEFSRSEVITAFDTAFGRMGDAVKTFLESKGQGEIYNKWQRGEDLDATETTYLRSIPDNTKIKKTLSDYRIALYGRKLTDIPNSRDKFQHEIHKPDGTVLNLEEGVPTDGILDFLREEIIELRKSKSGKTDDEKKEIDKKIEELVGQGHILYKKSAESPDKVERGHPALDGTQPFYRAQAEAQYISQDPLRDTGDETGNFYAGLNAMRRRRNLDFHAAAAPPAPAPTTPPGPGPGPAPAPPAPGDASVPAPEPAPDSVPVPGSGPSPDTGPGHSPVVTPVRLEDLIYRAAVDNRSIDLDKRSREVAEQHLHDELRRPIGWNPLNFFRRAGIRVMEEYFRQRWTKEARDIMITNNNSYLTMDWARHAAADATYKIAQEKEAGKAKVEQVKIQTKEGIRLAGEQIVETGPLRDLMINEVLRTLVTDLQAGTVVSEADMQQRLKDFVVRNENNAAVQADFDRVFGRKANQFGHLADYFATDFLEVGKQIVADHNAHHFATDQLLNQTEIVLANTSWAAETQANLRWIDRRIADIERHRLTGALINPLTLGAAFSLGTFGLLKLPGVAARTAAIASPIAGGMAGGLFAAFRRSYDLKVDRAAHMADMAYNLRIPANARRREALERFNYNKATVGQLLNGGGQDALLSEARGTNVARKAFGDLIHADLSDENNRKELLSRVLEIQARLDYSAVNKIDLITFDSKEQVEQGRLSLVKAIVEARQALRHAGLSDMRTDILEAALDPHLRWGDIFKLDQQAKDRAFNGYRLRQAALSGGIGFLTGVAGGLVSQEGWKLIREAGGAVVGLTAGEQVVNAGARLVGAKDIFHESPSIDLFKDLYVKGGSVDLGNNFQANVDPATHVVSFIDSGTKQPIAGLPPVFQEANGHIVVDGDVSKLPQTLRDALGEKYNPVIESNTHSVLARLKEDVRLGNKDVIDRGNLHMTVNGSHIDILDTATGKVIPGTIDANGKISLFAGQSQLADLQALHADLAKNGFNVDATIADRITGSDSVLKKVLDTITNGRNEVFTQGNVEFTVDGKTGGITLKDLASGDTFKGTIDNTGKFILDSSNNPNLNFGKLEAALKAAGFADVDLQSVKGSSGSVIDRIISRGPDALKKLGITQTFDVNSPQPKPWNFHVLRPDIVAATGDHTHNELTAHLGQWLNPQGKWETGQVGLLNFAGEIRAGQAIPSHLLGVPPAYDNVLNALVNRSGPVEYRDMVFVIDLNDGNQIMIQSDNFGNIRLPEELFDKNQWLADPAHPEKALRGIKSFAAAVLEKKDGTVLRAADLTAQGLPKDGVTVHSLASVAYETANPPPVPGKSLLTAKPSDVSTLLHHYSTGAVAPQAFEITPPLVEDPLGIATPFNPRRELEKLFFLYYGYGGDYSSIGLFSGEQRDNRRSETIRNNPDADLDEDREVNSYLNRQATEYRRELEQIDQSIQRPMSEQCRVVVTIPAFEEGQNIKKTLEYFLQQKDNTGNIINPDLFEIVIVDNHPENRTKDNTEDEVKAFLRAHPQYKISYVHKAWKAAEAGVGRARKYAADLALLRSEKRTNKSGELIIVSFDADVDGLSEKYVSDFITEFDRDPKIEAIAGKWTLSAEVLKKSNLRAAQRFWYTLDRVISLDAAGSPSGRGFHYPGLIGRNSAFRAKTYAAIGGYNPNAKLAEDLEIGLMIGEARNWNRERITYLNRAEVISNPRRYLAATVQGIPLIDMYGDFHENQQVRSLDNQALLNSLPDTFDINRFQQEVDALWQKGKHNPQYNWLGDRFDPLFQRAMGLIGAEYTIENDHVKVTNVDRLLRGLNRPINP